MCRGLKKYSTNAKRNGEGFEDLITNEWKEKKKWVIVINATKRIEIKENQIESKKSNKIV